LYLFNFANQFFIALELRHCRRHRSVSKHGFQRQR